MDFLNKIENIIIKIEKIMMLIFGSIMMISVFLQIFFRYVIRTSVPWTEEISIISFIMMFFYGASFASYQKRHLGINNFVNKLPETSYKIVWFAKNIIILLFLISIIVISSFPIVIGGLNEVSVISRIPRFYIFIQIPILGLLFFLHLMMSFLRKDYLKEFSLIKKKEI
jgi:TRAP-type C4-dicarboxylate transport system permease small subunit